MSEQVAELVERQRVLVCCGPGGVGKTTVAAALALAGALAGRRTCVVTIDPARRLADALGVELTPNAPHEVQGDWPGSLAAVMLDAGATFDELVARYAADEEQAARIRSNTLYRNLTGTLSGTQEYMATERLFELHERGEFDLIVVDTPPSRHALDFLAAPRRLTGFLDNRMFRLLLAPGRATLRAVGVASQLLLRTIGRVAGSEIVEDTVAFFQAFEGMEQGFRDRALAVEQLLAADHTAFVLVTTPREQSVEEAAWLAEQIAGHGRDVAAVIANRVLPTFASPPVDAAPLDPSSAWSSLLDNARDLAALGRAERVLLSEIGRRVGGGPPTVLALLDGDVHELATLERLARDLVAGEVR